MLVCKLVCLVVYVIVCVFACLWRCVMCMACFSYLGLFGLLVCLFVRVGLCDGLFVDSFVLLVCLFVGLFACAGLMSSCVCFRSLFAWWRVFDLFACVFACVRYFGCVVVLCCSSLVCLVVFLFVCFGRVFARLVCLLARCVSRCLFVCLLVGLCICLRVCSFACLIVCFHCLCAGLVERLFRRFVCLISCLCLFVCACLFVCSFV